MNNRTMRIVRTLADIRRAQRCTALRDARAAAEADAELARAADPSDAADEAPDDDTPPESVSRIRSPSR